MSQIKSSLLKFAMVGVTNSCIGLSVIYVAWRFFGMADVLANALGYAIGFAWGYWLNRRWTFNDKGSIGRSAWRYAMVCISAYLANLGVLYTTRSMIGPHSFVPHALGLAAYTVAAYFGCRIFAFKQQSASNA
jgi:putative flippase GtrA